MSRCQAKQPLLETAVARPERSRYLEAGGQSGLLLIEVIFFIAGLCGGIGSGKLGMIGVTAEVTVAKG